MKQNKCHYIIALGQHEYRVINILQVIFRYHELIGNHLISYYIN